MRDPATGTYRVDFDRMMEAMAALSELILTLQGNGDYEGAKRLTEEQGIIREQLATDLERLLGADIPVDIVFRQGADVLGLE